MTKHAPLSPNLLCIVPPYATDCPPAGAAALLGYLEEHGCHDFDFVDLRLYTPPRYAPTYRPYGCNNESYVIDLPDLPLVLELLAAYERGEPWPVLMSSNFEHFCVERDIDAAALFGYLKRMGLFLDAAVARMKPVHFIGFSTWTSNYLTTLMAAARLKQLDDPPAIIAGGPQVSESRGSAHLGLRSRLFDVVVNGEGEYSLLELYQAFDSSVRRVEKTIPGTSILGPQGTIHTEPRRLRSLRHIPAPNFDPMVLGAYRTGKQPGLTLPYQLSRGCTDRCEFCSEWVFWERFRPRRAEQALEQVQGMIERYGATKIRMMDSLLNGHPRFLTCFSEGLIERNLPITWSGFMRAQIEPELADLLAASGFKHAFIGVESLSDETLASMNKRRKSHNNIHALKTLLEAGVAVRAGLISGFPGDTPSRFETTLEALADMARAYPDLFTFSVEPFVATPNQPLMKDPKSAGLSLHPWPERVIDIAPQFADITMRIVCQVRGKGQSEARVRGLERANKLCKSAYSWPSRLGTTDTPRWVDIRPGWSLLVTRGPNAEKSAWLANDSERTTLCGREENYHAVAALLSDRHIVHHRGMKNVRSYSPLHPDSVRLNPLCIARLVEGKLLVLCSSSGAAAFLSEAAAPLVASLSTAWIPCRNLLEIDHQLTNDPALMDDFIDRLAQRGLVLRRGIAGERT